jgi:tetratricopeptide (TPR) repeat protein
MIRKILVPAWILICFLTGSVLATEALESKERNLLETGIEFMKQDLYEAAIAAFSELIDLDNRNPDAYKNRGVAHMKLAQYDQAIRDFEKTLEITPGVKGIYSNLGVAWYYKSDYRKAIENYDREIILSPDSHYAYFNRAISWAELGEYGKSLNDIGQTLSLAPDFYPAYCLKGDLYLEMKDIGAARIAYEQAIEKDPEQEYARVQLDVINASPITVMEVPSPEAGVRQEEAASTPSMAAVKTSDQTESREQTKAAALPAEKPVVENLGGYEIQVGAFQVQENAQKQLDQLIRMGYDARILTLTRDGKTTWYLVRFGSYPGPKQSEQARAQFVKDTGMEAYVRPRNRF